MGTPARCSSDSGVFTRALTGRRPTAASRSRRLSDVLHHRFDAITIQRCGGGLCSYARHNALFDETIDESRAEPPASAGDHGQPGHSVSASMKLVCGIAAAESPLGVGCIVLPPCSCSSWYPMSHSAQRRDHSV